MPDATWVDAFLTEDDEDAPEGYEEHGDAIDEAVAGEGYIANFVIDECVETFEGGFFREPERFDRFYYRPQDDSYRGPAPILIDVLTADDEVTRSTEAERKHVEFKRRWCVERELRYVVLAWDEAITREAVLRAMAEQLGVKEAATAEPRQDKPVRKPAVQRPAEDED
jgi:hypothetical protein